MRTGPALSDELRQQCEELGLVLPVPTSRARTRSQQLCGKGLNGGFSADGRPKVWPNYCRSRGCTGQCAPYRAEIHCDHIAETLGFVRVSSNAYLPNGANPDKHLWVANVERSLATPAAVGERIRKRVSRVTDDVVVNHLRIPCEAWIVVVASHDLTAEATGRPSLPPRLWVRVGTDVCLPYVEYLLGSGVVAGAVWATEPWRQPKSPTGIQFGARGDDASS